MAHRKTERNPLFAGRWFEDDIILLCLRWYFRFQLSYRDLVEILGERGLPISHTSILRWVVRYAEICERRWSRFERPVGGSWRVDETFIKVRGQWMYLYRAVDGQGNTVEFFLSRARGIAAAKAFFRKALKHHREPHSITLDGHRPSHSALRHMGMNGEFNFRGRNPVKIRCCQYLNNVVEQDHRRVKGRLRPMLGFKTFYNARRVIIGIKLREAEVGLAQGQRVGQVSKQIGVTEQTHLGSPHETEKLYANPPNSRSWLTTALSPALSCFCPVEAYPSLTSGTGPDRVRLELKSGFPDRYRQGSKLQPDSCNGNGGSNRYCNTVSQRPSP